MRNARTMSLSLIPVLMLCVGAGNQPSTLPAAPPSSRSAPPPGGDAAANQAGDQPEKVNAEPVDLADHCRFKAASFDKATLFPWPAVPRGSQTFAHVPLEISGAIFLWGERNANQGMKFPEEITGIRVDRKFETLYTCHGGFFEGKAGTPMYEIHFQYADGTSEQVDVKISEATSEHRLARQRAIRRVTVRDELSLAVID